MDPAFGLCFLFSCNLFFVPWHPGCVHVELALGGNHLDGEKSISANALFVAFGGLSQAGVQAICF